MTAARRAELAVLASNVTRQLAAIVPDCEEGAFVAGRIFAMIFANGIDLVAAGEKGMSIDDMLGSGAMMECRQDMRGILEVRLLHELPPGLAN